jgi:ribokinase
MVAQVERYPEADDEVFVSNLTLFSGGAAANTAYACAKLGLKTAFIGKLGRNDVFTTKILTDFREVMVDTNFIKYSDKHNTGSAFVALKREGERRIFAFSGAANFLSRVDIREEEITQTKAIYLSSLKNIESFIQAASIGRSHGIPIVLNPGMLIVEQGYERIKMLLRKTDILIMSQREFRILYDIKDRGINPKSIQEEAFDIFSLGIRVLVITIGEKGAIILTDENAEIMPSIRVNNVADTTGAGDAFSAGFLWGFIQNLSFLLPDLKENVKRGNLIAARCIEQLGARNGIPKREEIELG